MAIVAFLVPASALAWTPPTITPLCAPDAAHYAFTVTLDTNTWDNTGYQFDWAYGDQMPTTGWTTVVGTVGDNNLVTPRGQGRLWVRWTVDHDSYASANPNGEQCTTPTYCIAVHKYDQNEDALAGAGFTLTGQERFTNSDGFVEWCGLVAGDYTLSETTPPDGYAPVADQVISLPGDCEAIPAIAEQTVCTFTLFDDPLPTPTPTPVPIRPSAASRRAAMARRTGRKASRSAW